MASSSPTSMTAARLNIYQEAMQNQWSAARFMQLSAQDPIEFQLRLCEDAVADPEALVRSWMEFMDSPQFQQHEPNVPLGEISAIPNFNKRVSGILHMVSPAALEKARDVFEDVLTKMMEPNGEVAMATIGLYTGKNITSMQDAIKSIDSDIEQNWSNESDILKGCQTSHEIVTQLIAQMIMEVHENPIRKNDAESLQKQESRCYYITSLLVGAVAQFYRDALGPR